MSGAWLVHGAERLIALIPLGLRISVFVALAPVFGHPLVPLRWKAALALLLTALLAPMGSVPEATSWDALQWVLVAATELALGAAIALIAQLPFAAMHLAGQVAGFSAGLTVANIFDPATHAQSGILAQLALLLALALWLALGGHRWLIEALAASVQLFPPASLWPLRVSGEIAALGAQLFRWGLQLAAAVVLLMFLLQLGFGLLARAAPQIQVFFVGVPLATAIGLFAFALALPTIALALQGRAQAAMRALDALLQALGS